MSREVRENRMKNLGRKVEDQLAEEIRKFKKLMRGVKEVKNGSVPQIYRIKGLTRFEKQLKDGIFSLYISPYAEWVDDFEIETKLGKAKLEGGELERPKYTDFEVFELGFYIYGKNLDKKELMKWFNKNMITVSSFELTSRG